MFNTWQLASFGCISYIWHALTCMFLSGMLWLPFSYLAVWHTLVIKFYIWHALACMFNIPGILAWVDLWAEHWHKLNFVPKKIELDSFVFAPLDSHLNINDDKDRLCESKEGSEPGDDVADDVADHSKVGTVRALRVIERPNNYDSLKSSCIKKFYDNDDITWGKQQQEFHRYQEKWQKWSV